MKLMMLLAFCLSGMTAGEFADSCPEGYSAIGGSCYQLHNTPSSWENAMQTCEATNSRLASVENESQYNGLLDHIAQTNPGQYWLSGCYTANKWIWTGAGKTMNPSWFGRSPARVPNQCAYFCSFTRKYWNASVSQKKMYICQRDEVALPCYNSILPQ